MTTKTTFVFDYLSSEQADLLEDVATDMFDANIGRNGYVVKTDDRGEQFLASFLKYSEAPLFEVITTRKDIRCWVGTRVGNLEERSQFVVKFG